MTTRVNMQELKELPPNSTSERHNRKMDVDTDDEVLRVLAQGGSMD